MSVFLRKCYERGIGADTKSCDLLLSGLGEVEVPRVVDRLTRVFKSILAPESNNLTFEGMRALSPKEAITYMKLKNIPFEYLKSDFSWYEITFMYKGHREPIKHCMRLPFAGQAGTLSINGNDKWFIGPVLSDKSISPSSTQVFVRLLRIKMELRPIQYSIVRHSTMKAADGKAHPREEPILGLLQKIDVYNPTSKAKVPNNGRPTPMHYLLTEYGMMETLTRLLGFKPIIGSRDEIVAKYSSAKYHIYRTIGLKPSIRTKARSLNLSKLPPSNGYAGNNLAIAIPVSKIKNKKNVINTMVAITYILDVFPETTMEDIEDKDYWIYTLGLVSMGAKNPTMVRTNIASHLKSKIADVDVYMKALLKEEFGDTLGVDIEKDGFFAILQAVMTKFEDWMRLSNEIQAIAYDKKFDILYFLLSDFTTNINKLKQEMDKVEAKQAEKGSKLDRKIVMTIISSKLNYKVVYGINDSRKQAVSMPDFVGDNMALKHTNVVEIQSNTSSSGKKGTKNRSLADPTTLIESTHLLAGTVCSVSKSKLSPLSHPNFYLNIDPRTLTITRLPQDKDELSILADVVANIDGRSVIEEIPKEFIYR